MIKKIISLIFALFIILFFPFWFIQICAILYIIIIVFSFLYSRILFNKLIFFRDKSIIRAYKFQIINVDIFVKNNSMFPVHYLSVNDKYSSLMHIEDSNFLISMFHKQQIKLTYHIRGTERGEYSIGPVIIKSGDPFGIFPWEKKINDECKIIIYPSIFELKWKISNGIPSGNIKVKNKIYEDVTRFKSIREYIPGDDLKKIRWKVSARLGSLHTSEYEASLNSPAILLLNLTLNDYPIKYRYAFIEKAIESIASLIFYFIHKNQEIGLISSGLIHGCHPQIPINGGHEHAMTLLENLAIIKVCEENIDIINLFNNSPLRIPYGARIITVGPFLNDKQIKGITNYRKHNTYEFLQISDARKSILHPKIKYFFINDIEGKLLYAR